MVQLFDRIGQDLKSGLRKWAKQPGSTALIIGTLAVGIGVNATIFGIVDAVLLRPLPTVRPSVWLRSTPIS